MRGLHSITARTDRPTSLPSDPTRFGSHNLNTKEISDNGCEHGLLDVVLEINFDEACVAFGIQEERTHGYHISERMLDEPESLAEALESLDWICV